MTLNNHVYLIDENISNFPYANLPKHIKRVVDLLGPGTLDETIREYIKANGYILVTKDRMLVHKLILEDNKMVVYRDKNKSILIEIKHIDPCNFDPLTNHLQESDQVVIP